MRIVIVGAGSIGTLLAGLLARSKEDVWLFVKTPEKAKQIDASGVSVEGVAGSWQAKVRVTAEARDIQAAELVIICVKSYDTKSAVKAALPLIGETTSVLTLQNGMGNLEILQETVGAEKVIGGITSMGATLISPGRVRYAGKGETVIGRMDGSMPVVMREIRERFNRAGIETRISRDIKSFLWSKLIINAGINALTAVTRLNNGRLPEFDQTREVLRHAVTEAVRIAKRKRVKLIYEDPLSKVEAVCEATSSNVSSMLQDVLKKKKTEIDFINGFIVRQGQELGIPVPVNTVLTDLVKTIEASYDITVK